MRSWFSTWFYSLKIPKFFHEIKWWYCTNFTWLWGNSSRDGGGQCLSFTPPGCWKITQIQQKIEKKRYFIRILRSDRVVSEHALGMLKGRFCIVYKKAKCPRQCKSCYHRLYCTSQFLYFAVWFVSLTLATQGGETHLIRKPTKRTQDGQLSQQVHATISRGLLSLQNFGDNVKAVIIACIALHNLCIVRSDPCLPRWQLRVERLI